MKNLSVLLVFSIILTGCFSESAILKNEVVLDGRAAIFYLNDGSYITSEPGKHIRVEGGYTLEGYLFWGKPEGKRFEGIVSDSKIRKITVNSLDVVPTVLCITFVVVVVVSVRASLGSPWICNPIHRSS